MHVQNHAGELADSERDHDTRTRFDTVLQVRGRE